jgi:hypothetical protein
VDMVHLPDVGSPLLLGVQSPRRPPKDWEHDTVGPNHILHIPHLGLRLVRPWAA